MPPPRARALGLVVAAFVAGAASLAGVASAGGAAPDWPALEAAIEAERSETGTPGMAVAVVSGERVVFARGFGVASIETGAPVTEQTLFQVGSVTKSLTAAALLGLAEEGRLRLDHPIGTYAGGLSPAIARLTLLQLLSHGAGLHDAPGDDGLHEEAALGASVRALTDDRLLLPPGRVFSYSNPGYAVAGHVLEAVAGKPFADVMDERVFRPLGMTRTTLRPTRAMTWPLAVGHRGPKEQPAVVRPMADDTRLWPAGYAYSSASELARFVTAVLNGGRVEGREVLTAEGIARMLEPVFRFPSTPDGDGYGCGVFVDDARGLRVVGHGGQMPGFSANWRAVPSRGVGVVVLANREGLFLDRSVEAALTAVLGSLPMPAPSPAPSPLPMDAAELARLAGTYEGRWSMELAVRDDRLILLWGGNERAVTRVGADLYTLAHESRGPIPFRIALGEDGRPEYLQMFLWAFRRVGAKDAAPAR